MQYEIYLDVIFLQYATISFAVLLIASAIRGIRIKFSRLLFATLFGAIAGCLSWMAGRSTGAVGAVVFLIVTVCLLSLIAFPIVSLRNYQKNCFGIFVSLFLLGGMSLFGKSRLHIMKNIMLFAVCVLGAALLFVYIVRCVKVRQCLYYPVSLYFEEEVRSVIALADSGNHIEDARGRAVCVLAQHLCPANFKEEAKFEVKTLGKEAQQMKGGMLRKMVVHTKEGNLVYEDVPIAFYQGDITSTGKFEMILQTNYCIRE